MDSPCGGRRGARFWTGLLSVAAMLTADAAQAQGLACQSRRVPVAQCFPLAADSSARCQRAPLVMAPCRTVHARLWIANGAPSVRLWVVGTRRYLGVVGPEGDAASPALLPRALSAFAAPAGPGPLQTVYGDFKVCPLAARRSGWMQPVCIAEATHLALATRKPND